MKCPVDQTQLTKRNYEAEVEIDECPTCQGVWLDSGELEVIQKTVEHDYSEALKDIPNTVVASYQQARGEADRKLKCPNCTGIMHEKEHGYCSQIMVDVCLECSGIWLDRGEIQALEIFYERSKPKEMTLKQAIIAGWQNLF
jgi:Zn-finger nucleic acid-binding protein